MEVEVEEKHGAPTFQFYSVEALEGDRAPSLVAPALQNRLSQSRQWKEPGSPGALEGTFLRNLKWTT